MQVSGKTLVLATFAIALAMAGGSWWHHYQESRRAAQFWGRDAAALLVIEDAQINLLTLGDPATDDEDAVAGRAVVDEVDVTDKPGMVHLRHTLTNDTNFLWDEQSSERLTDDNDWAYALRFTRSERQVIVLFTRDFQRMGKLVPGADRVDVLPCPKLGPVIIRYLDEVGVELSEPER